MRQDAEQREHEARAALSARENATLLGVHERVRAHREGRRLSGDAITPADLRRLASLAPEGDLRERLLRDAEMREHACEDCQGTGVQVVHVCEDNRECARKCPQVEACMGCLGTGRQPR